MEFKLAVKEDMFSIMNIIGDAQKYLASQEIDQWQDGYPDENIISNDIVNNESYIVKGGRGDVLGIAMFTTTPEPTYKTINGKWLTADESKYGVIHRMAVSSNYRNKGVAKFIIEECELILKETNISSMRIDTHEDNIGMKGLLEKIGYTFCGIIFLENGDKRLAFEKVLDRII